MKSFTLRISLSILLFNLIISCKQDNTIILKGKIKGLNDKWIYLHNNYPVGSPAIDSAQVINGKFEFSYHPDTVFQPRLVFLKSKDADPRKQYLGIINPYEKAKGRYVGFILEPGITTLQGDFAKSPGITLEGGEQNKFYFKNISLPYIQISEDSVKRQAQAERIIKLVHKNPEAYWALFALSNFKFQFTNLQLKNIYSEFSDNIKHSDEGKEIERFIANQPKNKDDFPDSKFLTVKDETSNVIDPTKKLNMVVFWASWCGPCRKEIPSLKKLDSGFTNSDLRIVSVSIDKDRSRWLKAVDEENMPWQQLLIPAKERETADSKYNLGWVPQIYLVNNKNKVINKIDGFSEEDEERIKSFITNYLTKN